VRLLSVATGDQTTRFAIEAFGQSRLTFGDLSSQVTVVDEAGKPVELRRVRDGAFTHVSFDGRGAFTVTLGP
jgi:hypothetical protein